MASPGLTLRPDQISLKKRASEHLRQGYKRVGVEAPTGTGKTVVAASMLGSAAERGFRSWFICHRRELLKGASSKFAAVNVDHGLIASGLRANPWPLVQVCSISTLLRCYEHLEKPRFVIWDEAHHLSARSWSQIHAYLPDAFHIGLSATWIRRDGAGLDQHFQVLVRSPDFDWFKRRGILVPYRHLAPNEMDLTGVRTRMGDYVRGELAAVGERYRIDQAAVTAYRKHVAGKRTIVFAVCVEESEKVVTCFRAAGISAEHVDAKTGETERDAIIERFARGETAVLSNVDLFGEGFDLPAVEAVLMLRGTQSLSLHLQQIGRCLRPSPGKTCATVIDLVGNWRRHGLASEARQWSLEARPRTIGTMRNDLWRCEACTAVNASGPSCEACGAPPRPPAKRRSDVDLWCELVGDPELLKEIRGMSHYQLLAWADNERHARMAAIVKGWKPGWAFHHLRERRAQSSGGAA
ncbi:DEAD/DEAH box helicase [Bradyrhizobium sp. AUGA SZCCT0182]|uniref:DEAD/DEAH box helicase n=1 Tax=Bradyrhizobium sp. AUGA SZCCT0182 TaxID=2807667 RepID=UPI001BAB1681|nr:DEAD/DEAH box helicase [Bradyrhizobium sp. AUGA SZCCT0182]MBR1237659.1 DEAD/DEAH box helicase [Bradyrhizobium sp. AUGA SZCCT0182]